MTLLSLTEDLTNLTATVDTLENKINCITINLKIAEYKTLINEYQLITKSEDENKDDLLEDKINEINICKDEIKVLVWSSEFLKCICSVVKFNLL